MLSPALEVPAPDVNTSAREMGWIVDTYQRMRPDDVNALGCITGKPLQLGGNCDAASRARMLAVLAIC
jgi:glutamate dehydrogenase (NAD(P)+)